MQNDIKKIMELERIINQVTSPTVFEPDLTKFAEIRDIINSSKIIPAKFVNLIKEKLIGRKHYKTQLVALELIEFTTCTCNMVLHNLYNSKSFLKLINTIFNQPNLSNKVKEKTLYLIQFWNEFFQQKKDLLSNFAWYYKSIKNRGIDFALYKPSIYLNQTKQNNSSYQNLRQNQNKPKRVVIKDVDQSLFNQKQSKLYKDLSVVVNLVITINSLISIKDFIKANNLTKTLSQMEYKMQNLPNTLQQKGEKFLFVFLKALFQDINQSKYRLMCLRNKTNLRPFNPSINQVIQNYNIFVNKSNSPLNQIQVINTPQKKRDSNQKYDFTENVKLKQQDAQVKVGFQNISIKATKQVEQNKQVFNTNPKKLVEPKSPINTLRQNPIRSNQKIKSKVDLIYQDPFDYIEDVDTLNRKRSLPKNQTSNENLDNKSKPSKETLTKDSNNEMESNFNEEDQNVVKQIEQNIEGNLGQNDSQQDMNQNESDQKADQQNAQIQEQSNHDVDLLDLNQQQDNFQAENQKQTETNNNNNSQQENQKQNNDKNLIQDSQNNMPINNNQQNFSNDYNNQYHDPNQNWDNNQVNYNNNQNNDVDFNDINQINYNNDQNNDVNFNDNNQPIKNDINQANPNNIINQPEQLPHQNNINQDQNQNNLPEIPPDNQINQNNNENPNFTPQNQNK